MSSCFSGDPHCCWEGSPYCKYSFPEVGIEFRWFGAMNVSKANGVVEVEIE